MKRRQLRQSFFITGMMLGVLVLIGWVHKSLIFLVIFMMFMAFYKNEKKNPDNV